MHDAASSVNRNASHNNSIHKSGKQLSFHIVARCALHKHVSQAELRKHVQQEHGAADEAGRASSCKTDSCNSSVVVKISAFEQFHTEISTSTFRQGEDLIENFFKELSVGDATLGCVTSRVQRPLSVGASRVAQMRAEFELIVSRLLFISCSLLFLSLYIVFFMLQTRRNNHCFI